MNARRVRTWSDNRKWGMGLVAAIVAAACTAYVTTKLTISSELDEGRALFDGVGYRYFALTSKLCGEYKSERISFDEAWAVYVRTLADIQADIRLLRTNPIYGEIQKTAANLVVAQNFLVAAPLNRVIPCPEKSAEGSSVSEPRKEKDDLLNTMCELYIESDYTEEWRKPNPALSQGIVQHAIESCDPRKKDNAASE